MDRLRFHSVFRYLIIGMVCCFSIGLIPVYAQQQIYREGFSGRQTVWLRGEDNVRAEEKAHELSEQFIHSVPTSEKIQLICPQTKGENGYVYYYFSSNPAPISEELMASIWLRATKSGIQLQARLVLPRELNNKNEPTTYLLMGDTYKRTGRWQKLEIPRPTTLVNDLQQKLKVQLRRPVDFTDAYIDRLVLNLYTGPGPVDVFIDDLEIGPVKPPTPPPTTAKSGSWNPTSNNRIPLRDDRGILVKMDRNRLFVGGKPFFFRAIRHSGTPLKTLSDAGFNSVYFDIHTSGDTLEEAIRHGFWIIPNLPLLPDDRGNPTENGSSSQLTSRTKGALASATDPDTLATGITRFLSGDSVLFWDLGGGRSVEQIGQVSRTAKAIQKADPNRPLGADIWDGFRDYSQQVQMIGAHRFPLMSSLELTNYRDWLVQRRYLTENTQFTWTWIQTHMPEWQAKLLYEQGTEKGFKEPIGPQPEQVRLMTYLSLASGCKGLGFWSDQFLADSHQGRDRLTMMALLNQEIYMLEPILLTLNKEPTWIDTNHPQVKAAVLRSERGILVLPIWLGGGAQYVPPQGVIYNLSMIVPFTPDGTQPWEVSPARVQSLQQNSKRKLGGTELTIPEFDLTTAVVFTSDLSPEGLVVKWQDHSRRVSQLAAQWMIDLAMVEYEKVRKVHDQLTQLAPEVVNSGKLIRDCEKRLNLAREYERDGDYQSAYIEAQRSMRPLRILMRAHWEQAVVSLDFPTASPYSVSFYTLPRHWKLHNQVRMTKPGLNNLREGDFEIVGNRKDFIQMPEEYRKQIEARLTSNSKNPEEVPVSNGTLPEKPLPSTDLSGLGGWTVQQVTLDDVELQASLVPSWGVKGNRPPKPEPKKSPYDPSSPNRRFEAPEPPEPNLGKSVLRLEIKPKLILKNGNKAQPAPAALERTFLAVNSPPVRLTPGTLVRISGWVQIPQNITASPDGVLFYDSSAGDGMGLRRIAATDRQPGATEWKQFHFYRRVPESGVIWATVALTGIGVAHFDDIRIEPLIRSEESKQP
jgi:hypothetical protein